MISALYLATLFVAIGIHETASDTIEILCIFGAIVCYWVSYICCERMRERIKKLEIEVENTRSFKRSVLDYINKHGTYMEDDVK